jgi:hypothetical protein
MSEQTTLAQHRPKLLEVVNARIDKALGDNARAERVVIGMSIAIFMLGVGILGIAYLQRNAYFTGGALFLQGFLYWPAREILKIRRDNLMLQTLPALSAELPRADAAAIIEKALLDHLWKL